eukprot:TRINITY_DN216_c0_g1_i4.p1 TRINITY_DN216_c0_g1~~TRINITY_DN216_c0_g1_i4.p1  ORF type:complete len:521 (-),score=78.46 TRINITY_DN216_c0_g1_i4:94-1656(-)
MCLFNQTFTTAMKAILVLLLGLSVCYCGPVDVTVEQFNDFEDDGCLWTIGSGPMEATFGSGPAGETPFNGNGMLCFPYLDCSNPTDDTNCPVDSGAFTYHQDRYVSADHDCSSQHFGDGFTVKISVWLDTDHPTPTGNAEDYIGICQAPAGTDCLYHAPDAVVSFYKHAVTPNTMVATYSQNAPNVGGASGTVVDPSGQNEQEFTGPTGWYTITYNYMEDNAGDVELDITVTQGENVKVFWKVQPIASGSPVPTSEISKLRYLWFCQNTHASIGSHPDHICVDAYALTAGFVDPLEPHGCPVCEAISDTVTTCCSPEPTCASPPFACGNVDISLDSCIASPIVRPGGILKIDLGLEITANNASSFDSVVDVICEWALPEGVQLHRINGGNCFSLNGLVYCTFGFADPGEAEVRGTFSVASDLSGDIGSARIECSTLCGGERSNRTFVVTPDIIVTPIGSEGESAKRQFFPKTECTDFTVEHGSDVVVQVDPEGNFLTCPDSAGVLRNLCELLNEPPSCLG